MTQGFEQAGRFFAQRIASDAAPVGSPVAVAEPAFYPSVAGLAGGGFVVSWDGLWLQRFAPGGSPQGSPLRVNAVTTPEVDSLHKPQLLATGAGAFLAAWTVLEEPGVRSLYVRLFPPPP